MDENEILLSAGNFIELFIKDSKYIVCEKVIEDDRYVYQLSRNGLNFTLFMFAFEKENSIHFDEKLYRSLLDHKLFAQAQIPLIVLLKVSEISNEFGKQIAVTNYCGNKFEGEFWRIVKVKDSLILVTYLREGWLNLVNDFGMAFNDEEQEKLISLFTPAIRIDESSGETYRGNRAICSYLRVKRSQCGKAELAYMRRNDIIHFKVPYLQDNFYIGFYISQDNKIDRIQFYPMNEKDVFIKNGIIICPMDYDDTILE